MTTLWEELSAPWRACIELAWAAYRRGSLPVGAVVTDAAGTVIARGRNMDAASDPAPHALAKSALAHAELVALGKVKRPRTLQQCILYCSTEPCPMCVGAIRLAGLGELRYASRDPLKGGTGLLRASPYMRAYSGRVTGPESELLEVLLGALLIEKMLGRGGAGRSRIERWARAKPRATAFARYLSKHRLLERYAGQRAPAEGMLNTLEREFRRRSWKPSPAA